MDNRQLLRSALPLLGIGVIVGGILGGVTAGLAVLVGGACGVAHMLTLGRNVTSFVSLGADGRPVHLVLAYVFRLAVSAAVIVALIQVLDPIPLVIGFGLVLLAATVYVGQGGLLVPNPIEGA